MRILHLTDAAAAGVLSAVTTLAAAQAKLPGTVVDFAYTPRHDSPDLATIQRMAGPDVTVIRLCRQPRLAVPALTRAIFAALSLGEADVVHVHSSRGGLIGRAVGAVTGHRDKVVYSPHGFAFQSIDRGRRAKDVYRVMERVGARLGPRLALCSASEQAIAVELAPSARTAVLPNAVDVASLAGLPERIRRARRRPLQVVHVGRITPQKRPDVFGAAARRWKQDAQTPLRFRWLGDGDRSLLSEEVEVTGWLSREELVHELARADIMLFTTAAEAMPMALLEAQAMGIPAIGQATTGVVDVIEDGRTGYLVEDENGIDVALRELTRSEDHRARLGAAAVASMAERFELADLGERSLSVYEELGITPMSLRGSTSS